MEVLIDLWNSMDVGMRCAMGFMIWLIIILLLSNSGGKAGRGGPRYPM